MKCKDFPVHAGY